ncbi:MAG: VRR-NUC domain-containing protein [Treponema sp.]|jgi:hypothetical protein|nr:VRR-NUC domain-containing protein [Treponema sp.]
MGLNTGIYEADVIKAVDDALSLFGIFHFRNNTGAIKTPQGTFVRFGSPGSADFLGICPGGRFLSVEVKSPGGRLSPAQRAWLDAVNREGGVAMWVDSVDSLVRQLKERGVIT